jgi:hypothetical protein
MLNPKQIKIAAARTNPPLSRPLNDRPNKMPPQEYLFLKGLVPETLRLEFFILTSRRSSHRGIARLSSNQIMLSTTFLLSVSVKNAK